MSIKELKTRIALKYDTYANWKDSNLVLLPGEIGLCAIPEGSAEATTNPTVLFKVGDGTTPFKTLKWASALAADVYGWAKAEKVVYDDSAKTIYFMPAGKTNKETDNVGKIDLSASFTALDERIAAIEGTVGGDISNQLTALSGQINQEKTDRQNADTNITNLIGEGFEATDGKTVADKIEAVNTAVNNLKNTEVQNNSDAIADLVEDLSAELGTRKAADDALNGRLEKIEAFFEAADHDGETGGLNDALDTLVEIQNYLKGEGSPVDELLETVDQHGNAIETLKEQVEGKDDKAGLLDDMVAAKENISALQAQTSELEKVTKGYTGDNAIQNDVTSAKTLANNAQTAAEAAQGTADGAVSSIGTLNTQINGDDGIAATLTTTTATANKAKEDLANFETTVTTNYARYDSESKNLYVNSDVIIFNCGGATETIPNPT